MPIFRRQGRPGLLGAIHPSGIVAGTEGMALRAIGEQRTSSRLDFDAIPQDRGSVAEALTVLSALHAQGEISNYEFAMAKARLLER